VLQLFGATVTVLLCGVIGALLRHQSSLDEIIQVPIKWLN
jgi:hypothetical protein